MTMISSSLERNKEYSFAEFDDVTRFLLHGALLKESGSGKGGYFISSGGVHKRCDSYSPRSIEIFGLRLFDQADDAELAKCGAGFNNHKVLSISEPTNLKISVVSLNFFEDVQKWFEPVDTALQSVLPPPLIATIKGYVPYGFVDYDPGPADPTQDPDHSKKQRVS